MTPPAQWDGWIGTPGGFPTLWFKRLAEWRGVRVSLHKMVGRDDPDCFHTHPAWAVRIVLWGGYIEEVEGGRFHTWWPGRVGIVRPSLSHRIAGLRNGRASFSLWLRGPKCARIQLRGSGFGYRNGEFV